MRRCKAFIIAVISLFNRVTFKRKQRVTINFKRRHRIVLAFLDLFFDARRLPHDKIQLRLRKRRKANYERGI
jgi:hypothetical protein